MNTQNKGYVLSKEDERGTYYIQYSHERHSFKVRNPECLYNAMFHTRMSKINSLLEHGYVIEHDFEGFLTTDMLKEWYPEEFV